MTPSMRTLLIAAPLLIAGCSSSPTHVECSSGTEPKILYKPPLTPVLTVARQFRPSTDLHFAGVVTPPTEYRPYAKVWVQVASNGVRSPYGTGMKAQATEASI
jgi:hypothetical protein